jgi:uncharacterized protein (TIGR03435 family)
MRQPIPGLILTLLFALGAAIGQPAARPPAFDVASVKPSTNEGGMNIASDGNATININLGTASHGVVTLTNTTLSECIQYAYNLVSEDQISGPDWIRDRRLRVDIVAKAAPDTPVDQLLQMTQALLAERFHLVLHREPKPLKHFDLAVAKSGPRMPEATGDAPSSRISYGRGRLNYSHLSMHRFAVLLSRQLKEVVIDNTALGGFFDVNLEWTPDEPARPEAAADIGAPSIFKAVQQQLGLTLEASKAPIEILVVDSAQKVPSGN